MHKSVKLVAKEVEKSEKKQRRCVDTDESVIYVPPISQNRKSFTEYLDKVYDSTLDKMKHMLEYVEVVCTTVDAWAAHHRSYLGMTAHWINPKTLQWRKAAIACTRMVGRHTYDVLACKIEPALVCVCYDYG